MASEPRERSAPTKRRARDACRGVRGRSPSDKTRSRLTNPTLALRSERVWRASHASGARRRSGARETRVGESEGRSPSDETRVTFPVRATLNARVIPSEVVDADSPGPRMDGAAALHIGGEGLGTAQRPDAAAARRTHDSPGGWSRTRAAGATARANAGVDGAADAGQRRKLRDWSALRATSTSTSIPRTRGTWIVL